MAKFNRRNAMTFILLLLIVLAAHGLFLYRQWNADQYMVGPYDQLGQMQIFKDFLYQQFKAGNFFYSFDFGGGASFFTRLSYYYSTSLFHYLIMAGTQLLESLGIVQHVDMIYWAKIAVYTNIIKSFLIYLASLYYFKQLRLKRIYSMIGGFFYVFSSIYFRHAVLWEFFTDAMLFLPIILAGIEQIIAGKRQWVFSVGIALTLFSNGYFAYMNLIFAGVYALLRMGISLWPHESRPLQQFKDYLRFGLLGAGLGAPGFLTFVWGFLNTQRPSVDNPVPWWNINFLKLDSLLLNDTIQLIPILFILLFFIWSLNKNKPFLFFKCFALVFIILRASPKVASLFNGFSYPQYRFPYLTFILIAVMIAMGLQLLSEIEAHHKFSREILLSTFITMILYGLALYIDETQAYNPWLIMVLIIAFSAGLLWINTHRNHWLYLVLFTGLTLYPLMTNQDILIEQYRVDKVDNSMIQQKYEDPNTPFIQATNYVQEKASPIERIDYEEAMNWAMQQQVGYLGSYVSFQNQFQQQMIQQFGVINQKESNGPTTFGFAGRTILNSLMEVNYILAEESSTYLVPFDYEVDKQFNPMQIYTNQSPYAMIHPVVHLYSETDFADHDFKDPFLINGAIVPPEYANTKPDPSLKQSINFQVQGMEQLNDEQLIKEPGASINLQLQLEELEEYDRIVVDYTIKRHNDDKQRSFHYQFDQHSFEIKAPTDEYSSQLYRHQMELPYKESIDIHLDLGTKYDFEIHNVYGLSTERHHDRSVTDQELDYTVQMEDGKIDIRFNNQANAPFMVLPIFYETGWQLDINQEATDIVKTNYGLIGFPLQPGENIIQLRFEQPLLKAGFLMSSLSLIGLIIIKRRKKATYIVTSMRKDIA
ncbi:YfhO family protein [Aerococcaceae bacterium DSM 111020]|nr:YfhO family protein [Aerococcaceae bacterium DSM 111020]